MAEDKEEGLFPNAKAAWKECIDAFRPLIARLLETIETAIQKRDRTSIGGGKEEDDENKERLKGEEEDSGCTQVHFENGNAALTIQNKIDSQRKDLCLWMDNPLENIWLPRKFISLEEESVNTQRGRPGSFEIDIIKETRKMTMEIRLLQMQGANFKSAPKRQIFLRNKKETLEKNWKYFKKKEREGRGTAWWNQKREDVMMTRPGIREWFKMLH